MSVTPRTMINTEAHTSSSRGFKLEGVPCLTSFCSRFCGTRH
jgi:hypothetical protein